MAVSFVSDTVLGDGKEDLQCRILYTILIDDTYTLRENKKSFELDLSQLLQRDFYHKAQALTSLHGVSMSVGICPIKKLLDLHNTSKCPKQFILLNQFTRRQ